MPLQKRQLLTIKKPVKRIRHNHTRAIHGFVIGEPFSKWMTDARTPAPAGIGMPTKYFLPGRPGFRGCGLTLMLNRASLLAPQIRKMKHTKTPIWTICSCKWGRENTGNIRKPHI